MAINWVTGKPREGKTLWTICWVKELAEKENRKVYYCNIPEVTIEGWIHLDHPDQWMTDVENDSIVIIDEVQDFWGSAGSGSKVPTPILELSKHGKRGIDFFMITQDPHLVHTTPKKLAHWHYHVIRSFGTQNAMIYKWRGVQADPEKVKKKADQKIVFPYPKKAFGKKDKAGNWIEKPWYKSADVHNIKRQIPWRVVALPIMAVVAGLFIWLAWNALAGSVDKAKASAGGNLAAAVVPGAAGPDMATAPSAGRALQKMTKEEWIDQHKPRLSDFPNTAPKYDEVTKATIAPYPAACIAAKDRCDCYTQQGTRLPGTSHDVCQQIVQNGYFVDWALPEPRAAAPAVERSTPVQTRLTSAPAPGAKPVQTEDVQLAEWKKQKANDEAMQELALRNAGLRVYSTVKP